MKTEEALGEPSGEMETDEHSTGRGSFVAGLLLGLLVGAGVALLFAPDQGEKTRGRLSQRVRSLRDEAREGIDKAGARTRKELLRRRRRLKADLERVRERAKEALD